MTASKDVVDLVAKANARGPTSGFTDVDDDAEELPTEFDLENAKLFKPLKVGAKVHAVVRNPQKIPSVLERPGVTIFKGESTDAEAVARAAQGCTGVFLNTFPIPGLELSQAQTIIEASKKVGIKTIVASTTFFAHEKAMWDTPITKETLLHGYFSSKYDVEEAVKAAGFEAYTILQPAFCHFDFLLPNAPQNFPALSTRGELDHAMDDGATMLYTDADDIGAYAAAALLDPAKFDKQVIAMGHENLTMEEVAQIVSRGHRCFVSNAD
ncbi:hypothetical protein HYQ44_020198 [Verticillium longisporum]|nr:hypothetical protein HYQ44_020198 [Verticillium longisporum]